MKKIFLLVVLSLTLNISFSQKSSDDLIGTWVLTKYSKPIKCPVKGITKITIKNNGIYSIKNDNYHISGKWKLEKNKLTFFNSKTTNRQIDDLNYRVKLLSNNTLVLNKIHCSEGTYAKAFYTKE